jgi:hypothetical protein
VEPAAAGQLLTKTEVLEILPISARTLQRRRWDGTIKALAVNSRFFLYPKASIDEFLSKLQSGELRTITFDKRGQPRAKQQSQTRRERSSRKVVRFSSSKKAVVDTPAPKHSKGRPKELHPTAGEPRRG